MKRTVSTRGSRRSASSPKSDAASSAPAPATRRTSTRRSARTLPSAVKSSSSRGNDGATSPPPSKRKRSSSESKKTEAKKLETKKQQQNSHEAKKPKTESMKSAAAAPKAAPKAKTKAKTKEAVVADKVVSGPEPVLSSSSALVKFGAKMIRTFAVSEKLEALSADGKYISVSLIVDGAPFIKEIDLTEEGKSNTNGTASSEAPGIGNDGNQYFCTICKGFGDVVCCDGCPKVFHPNCLPPENNLHEDPWYCPSCKGLPFEEKRSQKHKCIECKQPSGSVPMKPCLRCKGRLHFPSCKPGEGDPNNTVPMCSNCSVEEAFDQEDFENENISDEERTTAPAAEAKTKKKRRQSLEKKKKRKKEKSDSSNNKTGGQEEEETYGEGRTVQATPGFFYFLIENRGKIERVLSRKHRYFNRLPKGIERNELIAKEGAHWWIKLRGLEQKRYLKMSMKDFEFRVVDWKEEKTIREMLDARDPSEMMLTEPKSQNMTPEDEQLHYQKHQRLHLGTSVGSKPFQPEPGKSNNRVLLELLQDSRFHPLPLFASKRNEDCDKKMAIPHWEVHGPVSTSVGDECLGCKRGWNHYCPVLQRRIPAMDHRARLQPPLSSLMASKIGLGLRSTLPNDIVLSKDPYTDGKESALFEARETEEAKETKLVPPIPSVPLDEYESRADDVVQFVEECMAMKVPEPPRPTPPSANRKSLLSRGALPIRSRRVSNSNIVELNKCGRCRAIIENDTGCIQCRRAQLVINTSKLPAVKTLRVQTTMLGRLTLKETNFDQQDVNDKALANSISNKRWNPSSVLPPTQLHVPTPKTGYESSDNDDDESEEGTDINESDDEQKEDAEKPRTVRDEAERMQMDENKVVEETKPQEKAPKKPEPAKKVTETKANDTDNVRQTRRQRSARLAAAAATPSSAIPEEEPNLTPVLPDRQKLAVEHREEANELHRQCLMVACSGILLAMVRRDPLCLFAEPVPTNVVGYSAVVKNPIDFSKIRSRVQRGRYTTLGAFVAEARLLCTNALAFNPPGSIYSKTAKELNDVLDVVQGRARRWMTSIKEAHSAAFSRRVDIEAPSSLAESENQTEEPSDVADDNFGELRKSWAEAVDMWESGDWLKDQVAADFIRTKENEKAYYGSIAIRRAAAAAAASLAPYTDSAATYGVTVRRTHIEDDALRESIDRKVARITAPIQLKDIPKWREEAIMKILRRVQNRRVEGRITSENGCARCDGVQLNEEMKLSLQNEAMRWGRNKKKGEVDTLSRVNESRLVLTTGLASANARALIGLDLDGAATKASIETVSEKSESVAASEEGGRAASLSSLVDAANLGEPDLKISATEVEDEPEDSSGKTPPLPTAQAAVAATPESSTQEERDQWDRVNDVKVNVKGSKIHGWGLYADQPFKKGDVVAEYVGEYVCNAVADRREKMYQERRIQDYQFRVDENLVIDATLKGGHGRYINHNCNSNCFAKIVDGKPPNKHLKRVIIIAQRDIKAREEITYDYQFPLELDLDARIPCNCGSLLCRGFMNWDLPEKGSKNRVLRTQKRGGNIRDRIRRLGKPLKK